MSEDVTQDEQTGEDEQTNDEAETTQVQAPARPRRRLVAKEAVAPKPQGEYTGASGVVYPFYDPPAFDDEGRLLRGAAHQMTPDRIQVEP